MSNSKPTRIGNVASLEQPSEARSLVVIGLGYIGLPTATMFARSGLKVTGVDVNPRAVETINRGQIHIVENGLEPLVHEVVAQGLLRAETSPVAGDAFIIAVPTPVRADHKPDLTCVESAARSIAPCLAPGNLVILESTSPVGTTQRVAEILASLRPDLRLPHQHLDNADVFVAYCPERVLPGRIIEELVHNDRVLGGLTKTCASRAAALYKRFVRGECLLTTAATAELVKLTENSFRDVNIAFANEMSMICAELGIDVWSLIELANRHPRVKILRPGPGVGGHCIAVDPWFIVDSAPSLARLIRTAREVNDSKPHHVVDRVRRAAATHPAPVVACLGLSYKANIDDLRESPAVDIVHELADRKVGRLLVVEPFISALPQTLAGKGIELVGLTAALKLANVVVLLVDHQAFEAASSADLSGKTVIDTRGLWRDSTEVSQVTPECDRRRAA